MKKPRKPSLSLTHRDEPAQSQGPVQMIAITDLQLDGGTQTRASLVDEAIEHYAGIMRKNRDLLPPIMVFKDAEERFWIGDGFHRIDAAKALGWTEIKAEIRSGNRLTAFKHSLLANNTHGVRRTSADKRRSIELVFAEKTLRNLSSRAIADLCGVGNQLVGEVRKELASRTGAQVCDSHTSRTASKRVGADGKQYTVQAAKRNTVVQTGGKPLFTTVTDDPLQEDGAADQSCAQETGATNETVEVDNRDSAVEPQHPELGFAAPPDASTQPVISSNDPQVVQDPGPTTPNENALPDQLSCQGEDFVLLDGSRLPPIDWDEGPIEQVWVQQRLNALVANNKCLPVERRYVENALQAEQVCLIELVRTANRLLQRMGFPGDAPIAVLNLAVCELRNFTAPLAAQCPVTKSE